MRVADVSSLGYRTDLALLQLGGSEIAERDDHIVVRSPDNPTYWWGNFLLLRSTPAVEATDTWLSRFVSEFPGAEHVALGVDGVDHDLVELRGFAERGLSVELETVMTATTVHEPRRPNRDATYRQVESDADWAQSVELRMACNDEFEPGAHRVYAERSTETNRALVRAGRGAWFGAFQDGQLLSQLGLYGAGAGRARFQHVETHPDARRRGLAGSLVHHVSRYGLDELGAATLVMVADPGYVAIDLYRSVGFRDTESQLSIERRPPKPSGAGST
jgi:ribosomal protein S18 acetylase RimI-like enzyme